MATNIIVLADGETFTEAKGSQLVSVDVDKFEIEDLPVLLGTGEAQILLEFH